MVDLVVREPSKQLLDQLSAIFNALQFLHSLYIVQCTMSAALMLYEEQYDDNAQGGGSLTNCLEANI